MLCMHRGFPFSVGAVNRSHPRRTSLRPGSAHIPNSNPARHYSLFLPTSFRPDSDSSKPNARSAMEGKLLSEASTSARLTCLIYVDDEGLVARVHNNLDSAKQGWPLEHMHRLCCRGVLRLNVTSARYASKAVKAAAGSKGSRKAAKPAAAAEAPEQRPEHGTGTQESCCMLHICPAQTDACEAISLKTYMSGLYAQAGQSVKEGAQHRREERARVSTKPAQP